MTQLHEVLAAEKTVAATISTLLAETSIKFSRISQFFLGHARTLKRFNTTVADMAAEKAGAERKELTTSVVDTIDYVLPHLSKHWNLRLAKHKTNAVAKADIVLGTTVMTDVPVDFLLDLEKDLPKLKELITAMPTLDPTIRWTPEGRPGVWKSDEQHENQTQKVAGSVVLYEATKEHPAQIKEVSNEVIVGTYTKVLLSGSATVQQKVALIKLCDDLLVAVKTARMRANSTEVVRGDVTALIGLFKSALNAK